MQQLTKNILIISIFYLILSCSFSLGKDGAKGKPGGSIINFTLKNYFENPSKDYLYKATINIYGNPLTGIFVLKKINDLEYRCVFTTEFGNKLIDIKVFENKFEKIFVVSDLDRKIVVETLADDLQKLLFIKKELTNISKSDNEYEIIHYIPYQSIIYTVDKQKYISKIIAEKNDKQDLSIEIIRENTEVAQKINIVHKNIKLIINLNLFTE